jgi:hypothetical protein
VASAEAADTMPPTGSHPVRAAISTRANDASSGGVDRNNTDNARTIETPAPPWRRPVKMPNGMPRPVARTSALAASTAVLSARSPTMSATGRVKIND